jgi:hypothetical protein
MNAITDQPSIGWLMVIVAAWTVAMAVIVLAAAVWVPVLWRSARDWLTRTPTSVDGRR